MKQYFVYILCSNNYEVLYVGVTKNLQRRIYEHQNKLLPGFTFRYNISRLVHVEQFILFSDAIAREKKLKKWNRQWKIDLINTSNPRWQDLSENFM